jgi:hypothetical protein
MSYLNILTNSGVSSNLSSDLGTGSVAGSGSSSSKNISKVTIFGFTILTLYSLMKILNFYGIGVDKYGPYLMFYVFLIIWVNVFNSEHSKL